MDAIAAKLGLEPTYQNSSFDTIFRDVASGQFDIVAAAATITPARSKVVDFLRRCTTCAQMRRLRCP